MPNELETTLGVIRTTTDRWTELTRLIPEELLRRRPLPEEWSALECLQHLLSTEKYVFPFRTRAFLDRQDLPGYNPDEAESPPGEDITAAELAAEFATLRLDSLKLLDTVNDADLALKATHADLGPVTLGEMLNEWAAHDLMHTVQAERAMMQPFIQASGSWKPFFEDHDVEA